MSGIEGANGPLFQNPPILHRKETFLHATHPLHAKFTRLTQQEEAAGLPSYLTYPDFDTDPVPCAR